MLVQSNAASRWRTALLILLACTPAVTAMASNPTPAHAATTRARAAYSRLPLTFEQNKGQTAKQVNFLSRGAGYTLFLTPNEAVMSLRHAPAVVPKRAGHCYPHSAAPASASTSRVALHMKLCYSNPRAIATGEAKEAGVCNYFRGKDPAKWRTNVATFGKVRYQNVYKGVDLLYYGSQGQQTLEYDFVVKPHFDYRQIALQFAGAKRISVTQAGDLKLTLAGGSVVWKKPLTYQTDSAGHRQTIESRYILSRKDKTVRFAVGKYDRSRTLVLDPFLTYSTYLGGYNTEEAYGIVVDRVGNIYVTGSTNSGDFPTTPGAAHTSPASFGDVFVTKLNPSGNGLVYSTYLGAGNSKAAGIALDNMGCTYVAGTTDSMNFPVTPGAFQTQFGGGAPASFPYDGYVVKLNATGNAILYATYLGGNGTDEIHGIAVDSAGNTYVAGNTSSTNFPVTPGAVQQTNNTSNLGTTAFVTELNPTATALVYSTYLGGKIRDGANGIVVDSTGNAFVTGYTTSRDFPTTSGAFQATYGENGNNDGFVTRLNATGTALLYSTYLGGSNGTYGDLPNAIALDSAGCAYVTGYTDATNFPVTPGSFQTKIPSNTFNPDAPHAFVTKLNATGTGLVYSTYLSGNNNDFAYGIAVDSAGCAYVTGASRSTNFPVTADAFFKSSYYNSTDVFLSKLNAMGTALVYSTKFGRVPDDDSFGHGIALDSKNNVYLTGFSSGPYFPTTANAYSIVTRGSDDAFILKTGTTDYDLLGDNRTALLVQYNGGNHPVVAWLMQGTTLSATALIAASVSAQWKVIGQADFDGDGHTDILWQNTVTGEVVAWIMNGKNYVGNLVLLGASNFVAGTPWRVVGVGDMDGDGRPDLLLRNMQTGDIAAWFLKGTVYVGAVYLEQNVPLSFQIVGLADMNGDGQNDIVFQDTGTHSVYVQYLVGTTPVGTPVQIGPGLPASYRAVAVVDLDQDGFPDIVFQYANTGEYDYWLLHNTTLVTPGVITRGFAKQWQVVAP